MNVTFKQAYTGALHGLLLVALMVVTVLPIP